jgi:ribosomal protein S18 acetylase RimI-like enzyme
MSGPDWPHDWPGEIGPHGHTHGPRARGTDRGPRARTGGLRARGRAAGLKIRRTAAGRPDTVAGVRITVGQYELDDDPGRVDRDTLWQFLSTEAYWGRWRTRSVVEQQLDSAWRVVGVYDSASGAMIGFARAVSDGAGFAYLADVYIDKEFRGRGLGVELVATMIDRGPGASFRWTLHTSDAHGLYQRFGFTQPDRTYLERPGTAPTPERSVTRPAPEPPGTPPATR